MPLACNGLEEEFGDDQLIDFLCTGRHLEPGDLLEQLLARVNAFPGTQPQGDDMTALIIRRLVA